MADEHEVIEVLPSNDVDHVGDVGIEGDHAAHEMRTLAEAGECRREYLVTLFLQDVGDAPIAPAAGGRAVHQDESLALGLRQRGLRSGGQSPGRQSDRDVADHRPPGRRMLLMIHLILPHSHLPDICAAPQRPSSAPSLDDLPGHSSTAV
jgi:hypothetical protein